MLFRSLTRSKTQTDPTPLCQRSPNSRPASPPLHTTPGTTFAPRPPLALPAASQKLTVCRQEAPIHRKASYQHRMFEIQLPRSHVALARLGPVVAVLQPLHTWALPKSERARGDIPTIGKRRLRLGLLIVHGPTIASVGPPATGPLDKSSSSRRTPFLAALPPKPVLRCPHRLRHSRPPSSLSRYFLHRSGSSQSSRAVR